MKKQPIARVTMISDIIKLLNEIKEAKGDLPVQGRENIRILQQFRDEGQEMELTKPPVLVREWIKIG